MCVRDVFAKNFWFWFLSASSVGLLIASFIVPPTGVIDPSVLAATGEIAGMAAIGTIIFAIEKGVDAHVQHGNTSVTVGDLNKGE